MSKAVLISIQPQWCELIANGKKTIEVRKTKPKLETPFKCYIYCTTTGDLCYKSNNDGKVRTTKNTLSRVKSLSITHQTFLNGKVIGEFVCDEITGFYPTMDLKQLTSIHFQMCEKSCVNMEDLYNYANNKILYGYHISDLVIYDKPKDLSEFYRLGKPLICDGRNCEICNHFKYMQVNSDEWDYDCDCQHQLENCITLKRPPQSWCYVESKPNNKKFSLKQPCDMEKR